jgi:hypothetical protein
MLVVAGLVTLFCLVFLGRVVLFWWVLSKVESL